jgi:hypothetical protein
MYPALITAVVVVAWGGVSFTFQPGDVVMVQSGGALESAIGLANIANVTGDSSTLAGIGAGISN